MAEGHEATFKKYGNDLDKIPDKVLSNEALYMGLLMKISTKSMLKLTR